MHILGEKLRSALTVCQIRLAYGARFSSQTALLHESPYAPDKGAENCELLIKNWSVATHV